MLEKEIIGNTVENWVISLLFVVGAYVIMKIISYVSKKHIYPFVKKTRYKFDDIIYYAVESPLLYAIMLIGLWIAIHRLVYPDGFVITIDHAYRILIILNVTWVFVRLVNALFEYSWKNNDGTDHRMLPIVKRTLATVIWIIGIITALSNIGVNISALLGTLGIGGIAFALAAQDTVKNIFGAFTILADKPFSIGDTVQVDGFEGTIVDVGIRSTKLQNYDKRIITFPNYKISDASIVNISSENLYRRVTVKLGLTYDTTPEKMKEAMNILKAVPDKVEYVKKNDVTVFFSEFADSAMIITFIYFIDKKGNIQGTISDVNMEILTSFNKASLSFAFPSQTLYIGKDDSSGDLESKLKSTGAQK